MMKKLYDRLLQKYPNDILQVLTNYSPGIPGKVPPFFSVGVTVNGTLMHSASGPGWPLSSTPDEALEQVYMTINM